MERSSCTRAAAERIRPASIRIPPAIPRAWSKRCGASRGPVVNRRRSMPGTRRKFPRKEWSPIFATARSGSRRSMAAKSPGKSSSRGQNHSQQWSPDGSRLAFASSRGDHGFIGVYDVAAKSVTFLAPSVDNDSDPQWSLDGKRIAFVRRPAEPRDTPQGYFIEPDRPHPWAIWVAEVGSADKARRRAKSGTAAHLRKDHFPTWPTTPAAAYSTGPPTIAW